MKWSSTKAQFTYRFIYTATLALKQFTELTANYKMGKPGCCRLFGREIWAGKSYQKAVVLRWQKVEELGTRQLVAAVEDGG